MTRIISIIIISVVVLFVHAKIIQFMFQFLHSPEFMSLTSFRCMSLTPCTALFCLSVCLTLFNNIVCAAVVALVPTSTQQHKVGALKGERGKGWPKNIVPGSQWTELGILSCTVLCGWMWNMQSLWKNFQLVCNAAIAILVQHKERMNKRGAVKGRDTRKGRKCTFHVVEHRETLSIFNVILFGLGYLVG